MKSVHFVYTLRNALQEVIYIGYTADPNGRFDSHSKDKSWWGEVVHKELDMFHNKRQAITHERNLIKEHRPAYNSIHNNANVGSSPYPDYEDPYALEFYMTPCRPWLDPLEFTLCRELWRLDLNLGWVLRTPRAWPDIQPWAPSLYAYVNRHSLLDQAA